MCYPSLPTGGYLNIPTSIKIWQCSSLVIPEKKVLWRHMLQGRKSNKIQSNISKYQVILTSYILYIGVDCCCVKMCGLPPDVPILVVCCTAAKWWLLVSPTIRFCSTCSPIVWVVDTIRSSASRSPQLGTVSFARLTWTPAYGADTVQGERAVANP